MRRKTSRCCAAWRSTWSAGRLPKARCQRSSSGPPGATPSWLESWLSLEMRLPCPWMGTHLTGFEPHCYLTPDLSVWIQFALATPVVVWCSWPLAMPPRCADGPVDQLLASRSTNGLCPPRRRREPNPTIKTDGILVGIGQDKGLHECRCFNRIRGLRDSAPGPHPLVFSRIFSYARLLCSPPKPLNFLL